MAGPTRSTDTGDDAGARPGREARTGTPRWVKLAVAIALVLALVVAIVLLTGLGGPGGHGPGRHSGDGGGRPPPASIPEEHTPPPGSPDHRGRQP